MFDSGEIKMRKTFLIFFVLLQLAAVNSAFSAEAEESINKPVDSAGTDEAAQPKGETSEEKAGTEEEKKQDENSLVEHKGDSDPMAPFAISPRLGYAWFGPAQGDFKIGDLSARNAFLLTLGLNMGGSGAGFNLVPYYSYEDGDSAFHSLGFGMEFVYRWLLAEKWYPHFGFGSKIGVLFASDVDFGLEAYLRIPVGFSYYFMEDLGMIFDFGFGYGMTGIMPNSVDTIYEFSDLRFGHGFMVDLSLGLTFP